MTVCSYFLEGRCRYGEKCWNEHPRGGRSHPSRGGGSVNRVWVNPSQRSGGGVVQPSSFSHGGGDWGRGSSGSGRDDQNFSFNAQNRFSTLSNTQSGYGRTGGGGGDDTDKQLEVIQKDMEVWQSSGQWLFSCYSILKASITGFVELSPEELRMEYYTSRATGDLQSYVNSVQQLANQWRSRVQELRSMSANTRAAMIAELNNPKAQASSGGGIFSSSPPSTGFGSSAPSTGFGSSAPSTGFGSSAPSTGFGSSAPSTGFGSSAPSTGFGSSAPSTGFGSSTSGFRVGGFSTNVQSSAAGFSFSASGPGFGSSGAQPASSGFGSSAPSASTFSFAAPVGATASKSSAAGFSFSSASAGGSSSSSTAPAGAGFGGGASATGSTEDRRSGGDSLYTAQSELTEDELREFTAKRFTLGRIPLRPPPAELLTV